jgi:hypothetical protein
VVECCLASCYAQATSAVCWRLHLSEAEFMLEEG